MLTLLEKRKLFATILLLSAHAAALAQFDPRIIDGNVWGTQSTSDGCPVWYHVEVWGTAPLHFQWYRDGEPMAGETSEGLIIWNATLADSGTTYYVVVSNENGSVQSSTGRLEIWNDFASPNLVAAQSGDEPDQVELSFYVGNCGGRPLDSATASDPGNYFIPGLTVLSAELQPSGTNVLLKTSHQRPHTSYGIIVNNVQDILGNVISSQNIAVFESPFSRGVFHRRFPHFTMR